jgi:hypothetical protein
MKNIILAIWLLALLMPANAWPADLAHIERTLKKEPQYQTKPKYALVVFGSEARFKVWLVLDGDLLYVDKNGNGDLTEPGKRLVGGNLQYFKGTVFKVGDITAGNQLYTNLELRTETLKESSVTYDEWPAFQKLMAVDGEARGYRVAVEVPLRQALLDKKGQPVTRLRHYSGLADANGFLQFADRPSDAPVIHFGGPWAIWPREGQKWVLGRPEEFTALIGTPGFGPGTLAVIQYHTLDDEPEMFVPNTAKPVLDVQFAGKDGASCSAHYVLENRC